MDKDVDNSDPTQQQPDPLEAQPITPASNVDKRDILLETVCAAVKDMLEQTSSISMANSTPTKN